MGEDMLMFGYKIVVTTLVSVFLLTVGVAVPTISAKNGRATVCMILILFLMCLFGMWF